MNKELEEVQSWLKNNIKYYEEQIDFIRATDCDYYDEEQSLYEKRIKIFETILNYIYNSIPREIIEEKIEELKNRKMDIVTSPIYSRDEKLSILKRNQIKREVLRELLEGK